MRKITRKYERGSRCVDILTSLRRARLLAGIVFSSRFPGRHDLGLVEDRDSGGLPDFRAKRTGGGNNRIIIPGKIAGLSDNDRTHILLCNKREESLEEFRGVWNYGMRKTHRAALVREREADFLRSVIYAEVAHAAYRTLFSTAAPRLRYVPLPASISPS